MRITGSIICTHHGHARAQAQTLGSKVEQFAADTGRYPATLDELALAPGIRGWLGPYARAQDFIDPWKRRFHYRAYATDFQLFSLGGDGRVGGVGNDADLAYEPSPET